MNKFSRRSTAATDTESEPQMISEKLAGKKLCSRLVQSLGATDVIFSCLSQIEVVLMQGLSKWMYNVAVSRVQVRLPLHKTILFSDWRRNIIEIKAPKISCSMKL